MIDAQGMQHRRVQIVNADGIFNNVVTVIVRSAVRGPRFETAPGHPHRETTWMMIASIVLGAQISLAIDGPTEFASPDDQRFVE